MIFAAAGLLSLFCLIVALPTQVVEAKQIDAGIIASTGGNLDSVALVKRSPAGKGKAGSSRSRPSSYYEVPAEQDVPSSAIISSGDFLGLVNKAIVSANKAGFSDPEAFYTQDGALKWLSRAKASLLRDEGLIDQTIHQYDSKMSNPSLTSEDRSRAEEKKSEWERLYTLPRDEDMEALVYSVSDSYNREIDQLNEELLIQREMGASRSDLKAISQKRKDTQMALRLWDSDVSLHDVRKMINKELELYAERAEAAKHSTDPTIRADMIDHATKAIAWYSRV